MDKDSTIAIVRAELNWGQVVEHLLSFNGIVLVARGDDLPFLLRKAADAIEGGDTTHPYHYEDEQEGLFFELSPTKTS